MPSCISEKVAEAIQWMERQVGGAFVEKIKAFQQMGLEPLHIQEQRKNPDLNFRAYTEINFQWVRLQSGKHKSVELKKRI